MTDTDSRTSIRFSVPAFLIPHVWGIFNRVFELLVFPAYALIIVEILLPFQNSLGVGMWPSWIAVILGQVVCGFYGGVMGERRAARRGEQRVYESRQSIWLAAALGLYALLGIVWLLRWIGVAV